MIHFGRGRLILDLERSVSISSNFGPRLRQLSGCLLRSLIAVPTPLSASPVQPRFEACPQVPF